MHGRARGPSLRGAAAALLSAAVGIGSAVGQTVDTPLTFTAVAVNVGNSGPVAANRIEFHVDRWSTDAERAALLRALSDRGPQGMVTALQKGKRVGFLRVSSSLGYDLRYARSDRGEDGVTTIVLLTDRPIDWWETRQWRPIRDFPFTWIELRVDGHGSGMGTMSIATRIKYDSTTGALTPETYESGPARLEDVRLEHPR